MGVDGFWQRLSSRNRRDIKRCVADSDLVVSEAPTRGNSSVSFIDTRMCSTRNKAEWNDRVPVCLGYTVRLNQTKTHSRMGASVSMRRARKLAGVIEKVSELESEENPADWTSERQAGVSRIVRLFAVGCG